MFFFNPIFPIILLILALPLIVLLFFIFGIFRFALISDLFFALSIPFFSFSLMSINQNIGSPISATWMMLFASIFGFFIAHYFKKPYTLLMSIVYMALWWGMQGIKWMRPQLIESTYLFVGFIFFFLISYIVGNVRKKQNGLVDHLSKIYLLVGSLMTTITLFFFSTRAGIVAIGDMSKGISFYISTPLTIVFSILLLTIGASSFYGFIKKSLLISELLMIFLIVGLFVAIAVSPKQIMFMGEQCSVMFFPTCSLSVTGLLWAIIFNIVLFIEILGLVLIGYIKKNSFFINLGSLFLFLFVVIKYFDWFFSFLDKSIFFIGAGILLLLSGWLLEKERRSMLSKINV